MIRVPHRVPIPNQLLAALPNADYMRMAANLEPVSLNFGEVLYEPGDRISHVYFPNDSLVSLLTLVDARLALEVGMLGSEGMVGVQCALGVTTSPVRALVQGAGTAMRMKIAPFHKELEQGRSLQRIALLFANTLMDQVAQTAACNRFHVVEARLARWLLMTRDRVDSDQFHRTHEFLGHLLGVRRVGVTKAARALQKRKLIAYNRGSIDIIDGKGLEAASCSCYARVKGAAEKT